MAHIIEGMFQVAVPEGVPLLWAQIEAGRLVRAAVGTPPTCAGKLTWEVFNRMPLELQGTPFQVRVLEAAMTIPIGETVSYGELAEWVGRPGAQRAVAQALKRNPIIWRVPCHRVIRSDGTLGGFAFGVACKARMLSWEQRNKNNMKF